MFVKRRDQFPIKKSTGYSGGNQEDRFYGFFQLLYRIDIPGSAETLGKLPRSAAQVVFVIEAVVG